MQPMLDPIVTSTRDRIARLLPLAGELSDRAGAMPAPRGFAGALAAPGLSVIAEVKRRSPSRGVLAAALDPVDRAGRYVAGGAAAISVLTEPEHFDGSDEDLRAVRDAVPVPVLRKDFTLDPVQVWEARAIGADAVLLILAILEDRAASELLAVSAEVGLDVLVEVHTEEEAHRAMALGASIVGVNNRDLATFEVDLATSERLAPILDGASVRVAESGVHTGEDAARLRNAGYDAVLVGESLVRSADPAGLLRELRGVS